MMTSFLGRPAMAAACSLCVLTASNLLAATADWAEEMTALPDSSWVTVPGESGWTPNVTLGSGGTWINTTNTGISGTGNNPTVEQSQYTIEYKFRFLQNVPTTDPLPGFVVGAFFYNSGGANPNNIGRTRHQIGYFPGGADLNFEVVGAGGNRHNIVDLNGGNDDFWLANEWQVVRVIFDDLAATPEMSMYLNGTLVRTVNNDFGDSLLVGQDDNLLAIGSQDNGNLVDTEWDYIRIKVGAIVPITEALNAPGGLTFDAADFNQDGKVDTTDFGTWQANFGLASGATAAQGDADADGNVDGGDFLIWQAQYGRGVGSLASASAVPEPSACLLLLCTSTSALVRPGRRRR